MYRTRTANNYGDPYIQGRHQKQHKQKIVHHKFIRGMFVNVIFLITGLYTEGIWFSFYHDGYKITAIQETSQSFCCWDFFFLKEVQLLSSFIDVDDVK